MKYALWAFAGALLLNGCASQPPVYSEKFVATVNDAGMKLFTLDIVLDSDAGRREPGLNDRRRGSGPSAADQRRRMLRGREAAMMARLDELLIETRFCSNGYFILEKQTGPVGGRIRGECKSVAYDESATPR